MRKSSVLIALLLSTTVLADREDIKFGMSKAQVKEHETGKLLAENPTQLLYVGLYEGHRFEFGYFFVDGALKGRSQTRAFNNPQKAKKYFKILVKAFIGELGQPDEYRNNMVVWNMKSGRFAVLRSKVNSHYIVGWMARKE